MPPPARACPGLTLTSVVPSAAMRSFTARSAPRPSATMAMTAATPITMPSIVRNDRSRFARSASSATVTVSPSSMSASSRRAATSAAPAATLAAATTDSGHGAGDALADLVDVLGTLRLEQRHAQQRYLIDFLETTENFRVVEVAQTHAHDSELHSPVRPGERDHGLAPSPRAGACGVAGGASGAGAGPAARAARGTPTPRTTSASGPRPSAGSTTAAGEAIASGAARAIGARSAGAGRPLGSERGLQRIRVQTESLAHDGELLHRPKRIEGHRERAGALVRDDRHLTVHAWEEGTVFIRDRDEDREHRDRLFYHRLGLDLLDDASECSLGIGIHLNGCLLPRVDRSDVGLAHQGANADAAQVRHLEQRRAAAHRRCGGGDHLA